MFTGIIQKVAPVLSVEPGEKLARITVRSGYESLTLGESIAVNGVCLTVAESSGGDALFFVSPETLERTTLGSLQIGSLVNLERALSLQDGLSGHIVQGHVDGLARLASIERDAESFRLTFEMTPTLLRYCVEKGSIALNGVSLTVNSVNDRGIGVTIIPHTWDHTQFSKLRVGDSVNVEVDVLAKYVERLCQPYLKR